MGPRVRSYIFRTCIVYNRTVVRGEKTFQHTKLGAATAKMSKFTD